MTRYDPNVYRSSDPSMLARHRLRAFRLGGIQRLIKSRASGVQFGETTSKGYVEADFTDAFKRYIPPSEIESLEQQIAQKRGLTPPSSAPEPPSVPNQNETG